jgi:hypothetical protein
MNGIHEVSGSIPLGSTKSRRFLPSALYQIHVPIKPDTRSRPLS